VFQFGTEFQSGVYNSGRIVPVKYGGRAV